MRPLRPAVSERTCLPPSRAERLAEAGGSAGVWLARQAGLAQERDLAAAMAAAAQAGLYEYRCRATLLAREPA
jgi:hypothetical protein